MMAARDDYSVGWICALPVAVAAAKATLDRIDDKPLQELDLGDDNNYILGTLHGHNVVVAYPKSNVSGETSLAAVATQLHASFRSIQFNLMVGIGGGVPGSDADIRLGDVVVSKSTAGWPGVVQYDVNAKQPDEYQLIRDKAFKQPPPLLLTATGKAETAAIFDESHLLQYLEDIVQSDPVTFAHPGQEQDALFEPDYHHPAAGSNEEDGCNHCNPDRIRSRQPREKQEPVVHYGLIASGHHPMRNGATRDKLAHNQDVLCFETEAAGVKDASQYMVIRGICDYADSHSSKVWHAYAAAAAAAYAKEILTFVPVAPKAIPLSAINAYAEAAQVLDALLLTRPEVDRKSLIALKGRRVDGTCVWLTEHPSYQNWLTDAEASQPLLWVNGGPGKGKTMLAIYLTEELQPIVEAADNVLLYYFCNNRDKNRNTALTIMRGIIHQWIDRQPHMAQYIKSSFEGTDTTKYTVSGFISLWRLFLTLLGKAKSTVVCVLDGLDECEEESLRQLLDAIRNYYSSSQETSKPKLKFVLLSRPHTLLEDKLGQYPSIRLDTSDGTTSHDVQKYVYSKVADLSKEQTLSEEMVTKLQQALLAGAEGTFLWVSFVANELEGQSLDNINEILNRLPKGLSGIYQRLLLQIEDKNTLVPILQWIVLAARPLSVDELTVATGTKASGNLPATGVIRRQLRLCRLLVKIERVSERDIVNLVHESAKEFFQSDQVKMRGIEMFYMDQHTHLTLLKICLDHIERGYGTSDGKEAKSGHDDTLLSYATQYWPVHFHQAVHVPEVRSEFARPFFQPDSPIRERWWKVYWELEKNGGNPPIFTLMHLAAYLGNVAWAKMLISEHRRVISQRDNYGRMPLSWAVHRGHIDMVRFLLNHGARVSAKDRSGLTGLHIAVTGQYKDIVCVLLDRKARLEVKTEHGDTPLIRAINANSREIIQILLEHGARVNDLPTPPGVTRLKGPKDPMEERVNELFELKDPIFRARYSTSSRQVKTVMRTMEISLRIPLLLQIVSLYLRYIAFNRYENMSVLQELVNDNKMEELRDWARVYRQFFIHLVTYRNLKRLREMCELPTAIMRAASPGDFKSLLVIGVISGSQGKLAAIQYDWREGNVIIGQTFSNWVTMAYDREGEEFLHQGVRFFLNEFDDSIERGDHEDNMNRTLVFVTQLFSIIQNKDIRAIEYFSRLIAEFFEGYVGTQYEADLFGDFNQACANEFKVASEQHDANWVDLWMKSIILCAKHCQEKGQDRFLNIPSAACLILCQKNAGAYKWLIGEAIPETLSALIAEQTPAPLQRRATKTLVECLIIGKQYRLAPPAAKLREKLKPHLHSQPGLENMINLIIGA